MIRKGLRAIGQDIPRENAFFAYVLKKDKVDDEFQDFPLNGIFDICSYPS
jgi:hypothetical protein